MTAVQTFTAAQRSADSWVLTSSAHRTSGDPRSYTHLSGSASSPLPVITTRRLNEDRSEKRGFIDQSYRQFTPLWWEWSFRMLLTRVGLDICILPASA